MYKAKRLKHVKQMKIQQVISREGESTKFMLVFSAYIMPFWLRCTTSQTLKVYSRKRNLNYYVTLIKSKSAKPEIFRLWNIWNFGISETHILFINSVIYVRDFD